MKAGFIAVIGKPNAGKSSLVNLFVGEKVSIVSPRAQTTRDKILGIANGDDYQMVFIDTPGIHTSTSKLGKFMEARVREADEGVDAVLIVIDSTKRILDDDINLIERYLCKKAPVFLAINKVDLTGYERVYPILSKLSFLTQKREGKNSVKEIVPVSAKSGENLELLKGFLKKELKDEMRFYDDDAITDKTERYLVCEIIREKALLYLQDEVPHGIAVMLQTMKDEEKIVRIEADIICEKESHKAIIIGSDGSKIKVIGEKARISIEKLLDKKVYLKLFVKIREDWRNRSSILHDVGY